MDVLKKVDSIDRVIVKLYPAFDYPVDRLIVDDESLNRFCYAVKCITDGGIPMHTQEYEDFMQARLLYLRKRSADRRRQGLPALARLGLNWEGPNQSELNAAVVEVLNARRDSCG